MGKFHFLASAKVPALFLGSSAAGLSGVHQAASLPALTKSLNVSAFQTHVLIKDKESISHRAFLSPLKYRKKRPPNFTICLCSCQSAVWLPQVSEELPRLTCRCPTFTSLAGNVRTPARLVSRPEKPWLLQDRGSENLRDRKSREERKSGWLEWVCKAAPLGGLPSDSSPPTLHPTALLSGLGILRLCRVACPRPEAKPTA